MHLSWTVLKSNRIDLLNRFPDATVVSLSRISSSARTTKQIEGASHLEEAASLKTVKHPQINSYNDEAARQTPTKIHLLYLAN